MRRNALRLVLFAQALTVAFVNCGGDDQTIVARGSAGEAGEAASGGEASGAGSAPLAAGAPEQSGGSAFTSTAGAGVGGAGVGGIETSGGAGDNLAEAGAGGSSIDPIVDVGVGCNPPPALPRLSPSAAGLPKAGLVTWLRADRGVYATDAQRVCAWADQSGHQQLFLAGAARPLWGAASVGSLPAINFDATGSYLSVSGVLGIPPTSARTYVAVVKLVSTTARFAAVMQGVGNSAGTYMNLDTNTFLTTGSLEGAYLTNNAYDTTLATTTTTRVHVLRASTMVKDTPVLSAFNYRVDGAVQTLKRTPGGLGNGNIEDFSGADFSLVGFGATAIIAEALIYDRALSDDESLAVETALKARYGIE